MQITVFGANGKVGRQVVSLALERDYSVVAAVHQSNPFEEHGALLVRRGDVRDSAFVAEAIKNSDAVISCLGSWGTKSKDIVSSGLKEMIPALEAAGVARIITVTGAGAFWRGDNPNVLDNINHLMLRIGAKKILSDGEKHLELLDNSKLDWTVVRSPIMTKKSSAEYRLKTKFPAPWATVPRVAVANCLVDQIKSSEYFKQSPFISKP